MEKNKIMSMRVAENLLSTVLNQKYELIWDREPGYELWGDIRLTLITRSQYRKLEELGFFIGSTTHYPNYISIRFRIYE